MEYKNKIRLIASQAQTINNYKNRKIKLLLCCANIYFNKQCLIQNLIPTYAKIKVASTSPAAKFTQQKTQILRIKDEIRFLYKKKKYNCERRFHHIINSTFCPHSVFVCFVWIWEQPLFPYIALTDWFV